MTQTTEQPVVVGDSGIELPTDTPIEVEATEQKPENQLDVFNYFPSTVYSIKKPNFLDLVKTVSSEALAKRRKDQPKLDPIYPVYQTENLFGDPRLSEFTNYIGATAWNILQSQGYEMSNKAVHFLEMWCQEHHRHSSMDEHVHGHTAQLIGFYFIDVPKDGQRVVISDPRAGKKQINLPETNMSNVTYASNSVNFVPEPGSLFFANAWLPHSFTRNASAKPMRFIHFTIGVHQVQQPQDGVQSSVNTENQPVII
jgi:hypothetical protein